MIKSISLGVVIGAIILVLGQPLWLLFLGAGEVLSAEEIWFNPQGQIASVVVLFLLAILAVRVNVRSLRQIVMASGLATVIWVMLVSLFSAVGSNSAAAFIEAFLRSMGLGSLDGTPVIIFGAFVLSYWLMVRNKPIHSSSTNNRRTDDDDDLVF